MRKIMVTAALAILGATTAGNALAADDTVNPFSKAGQLAISSDMSLSLDHTSTSPPQGDSTSSTTFRIAPAADYFVIDGLSVGGQIGYAHTSGGNAPNDFSSSSIGIGPRVGYNYNFTNNLGIWPRAYFMFNSASSSRGGKDGPSATTMTVGLFAPVLFHPAEHFFLGLGPYISTDISSKVSPPGGSSVDGDKNTSFGLNFTLGGYFNL